MSYDNPMDDMSSEELNAEARGEDRSGEGVAGRVGDAMGGNSGGGLTDRDQEGGQEGGGIMGRVSNAVSGVFGGSGSGEDQESGGRNRGDMADDYEQTGGPVGERGRDTFTSMLGGEGDTVDEQYPSAGAGEFGPGDTGRGEDFLGEERVR